MAKLSEKEKEQIQLNVENQQKEVQAKRDRLGYELGSLKKHIGAKELKYIRTAEDKIVKSDYDAMMKRLANPKNLYEGQKVGIGSKIEVKGIKKGNKIIAKLGDVKVIE